MTAKSLFDICLDKILLDLGESFYKNQCLPLDIMEKIQERKVLIQSIKSILLGYQEGFSCWEFGKTTILGFMIYEYWDFPLTIPKYYLVILRSNTISQHIILDISNPERFLREFLSLCPG